MVIEGFVRWHGSFSAGTWRTAVLAMSRWRRRRQEPSGGALPARIRRVPALGGWAAPLPTVDPQIVRRSARTLPEYGPDFRYGQFVLLGGLPRLVGTGLGLGVVFLLAQFAPTRRLLLALRRPGTGPDAGRRGRSSFEVTFFARGGGRRLTTRVRGGDPGYGSTATMAAEAALCLAFDRDRLPPRAGVLTPAVALGDVLLQRLRRAGIVFEVLESADG
jgi:short subunit dehydrogenase-like uncharacterized protein